MIPSGTPDDTRSRGSMLTGCRCVYWSDGTRDLCDGCRQAGWTSDRPRSEVVTPTRKRPWNRRERRAYAAKVRRAIRYAEKREVRR